ncbi:MAG: hypothetical protein EAZ65_02555 [Verrucomicrobia bacterium]|nr:MAG: hypothetical protein EAZ84_04815 [Verrucomicrobiota bacterium]TAE88864.1 MAG: hypothetical protein EAZ82_02170 [Verrucomicrobiota bacterium]TAF27281.1 MAG: hypothetical protein EAZ71_02135 [Verrucomicrobiota bacterium]TAF42428.1 MAG: hypothetical protein EAZ65_02555 [Verrucomicrobiota bacterium]
MSLYRLTIATLFRRKSWVICVFAVGVLPFCLQHLSSGTENPALLKPAIAQATWAMALLSTIFWGFFTAAIQGESNARSGLGEYFLSSGVSAGRQLLEMWLAVLTYLIPLPFLAAAICILRTSPALTEEKTMWMVTNFQYALLFLLVMTPLVALATAVASRFGSLTGFLTSGFLAIYGLYGVGYLKLLGNLEENAVLKWIWTGSPHYHFADPTERLRYKLGAIDWDKFPLLLAYFGGIMLVHATLSRLIFRVRATA